VTLRFAWPESFSARVEHTQGMQASRGDSLMGGRRTWWWKLEPGEQQGQRHLTVLDVEGAQSGLSAFVDPELSVQFDREGNFLGAEQPEGAGAMGLLEGLPLSSEQKAEVRQNVSGVLTEVARERWEQRVGRWNGVWLVPGEPLRRQTKMWVGQHMFEREEIEAEERTSIEVDVPCTAGEEERRCVRVVVETVPVRQYRESEPCERARGLKRFELVTEPHTLLPYLTRALRKYEMDSCRKDGTVHTSESLVVEEFVFTYGLEPASPGALSL
jgi:hypothetical protein